MKPRNPKFVDYLREWSETYTGEPFDNLSDPQRSKQMARYYAESVLQPRNPALLPSSEEDIEACVVDGSNDLGCDFVSRESGVVLVIQAKYSGRKKRSKRPAEELSDFESFRSVLTRLRNYRESTASVAVREIASEIDWDRDRFQLHYITLRRKTEQQSQTTEWQPLPDPEIPALIDRTEIVLRDEIDLNAELRDTLSLDTLRNFVTPLMFTQNQHGESWVQVSTTNRASYVGCASGVVLANLFAQNRSSIFSLNIRNYIGDTATNKEIRKTALTHPHDFFFFNNGISALAEDIEVDSDDPRILRCKNFSIVNGAQTVRSLHKASIENPGTLKGVQVLVRLTETKSKKTATEQEFLDNLTKFNNTQNSIKVSDFRSNDKIQSDLRTKFAALPSVQGKKFVYKNKRSGPGERGSARGGNHTIGMEDFTKTIYAFLYGPDDVFGGTGFIFDASLGGGYAKLFGNDDGILPALDNETFFEYAGIWFVCNVARIIWKNERTKANPALERKWMFFYALGEVFRCAYQSKEALSGDLRRLGKKPAWTTEGDDAHPAKAIQRASKLAFRALGNSYKQKEGEENFAHRNWFRSAETLELVSRDVAASWDLVSEYQRDYQLGSQ